MKNSISIAAFVLLGLQAIAAGGDAPITKDNPKYWYGAGYEEVDKVAELEFGYIDNGYFVSVGENRIPFYENKDGSINWGKVGSADIYEVALRAAQTAIDAKNAAKNIATKLATDVITDIKVEERDGVTSLKWYKGGEANVSGKEAGQTPLSGTKPDNATLVERIPQGGKDKDKEIGWRETPPRTDTIYALTGAIVGGKASYSFVPIGTNGAMMVDGKSVNTNNQAKIEINGYSKLAQDTSASEKEIPHYAGASNGVKWHNIGYFADGASIEKNVGSSENNYQQTIKIIGWDTQDVCEEELSKMLTDPGDVYRTKHHVLCRYEDGDEYKLHYLPLGGAISSQADGTSIVTNQPNHEGQYSIYGVWEYENAGKKLATDGQGHINWVDISGNIQITDSNNTKHTGTNIVFAVEGSNVKVTASGDETITLTLEAVFK